MNKKVIFVGGTSFSGSTFFHLTLANDPAGFAAGEVFRLFHPMHIRHLPQNMRCGCDDNDCSHWERVKKVGRSHLFEKIFEINPGVEFIVDSSKNIVWINEQSNRLAKQGIDVYHVVIWKTLLEFAQSLQKRNRLQEGNGLTDWLRYHRTFYSFFPDWRSVQYLEYTQNQKVVLNSVCNYLGIPNFDGKDRFWEKSHHVLGGNPSARIHLFNKDSSNYMDERQRATPLHGEVMVDEKKHRNVYYEKPDQEALQKYVHQLRNELPLIKQVEEMLNDFNVVNEAETLRLWPDLQLKAVSMHLKRIWQYSKWQMGKAKLSFFK
jgi:hypothetical protein